MPRLFTIASDETVASMICAARERLVLVAPGFSTEVALALAERIKSDGGPNVISVIVDVDPEVCRLGFGDMEAIEVLRPALASKGMDLQMQKGVRIGLVVADSEILIYSPTPRIIESGSTSEEKPNAIRISENGAQEIAAACGVSVESVPTVAAEIGRNTVDQRLIEATKADLKENPPRRFDLARLERVFNYKLEFVEFSVSDFRLNTRSVSLPAELLGVAQRKLQDRFRNTFKVFETGTPFEFEIADPANVASTLKVTEKWITDEAAKLRKEYFIPLGSASYGNLILKRRKEEFEGNVTRLTKLLQAYAEKVQGCMTDTIRSIRNDLIADLYPALKASPPRSWSERTVDGKLTDETLTRRLEEEVDRAFESVKQSFNPAVTCLFKGVNYETITSDDHFRERIEAYFGKEDAASLLSEYQASRAQERLPL